MSGEAGSAAAGGCWEAASAEAEASGGGGECGGGGLLGGGDLAGGGDTLLGGGAWVQMTGMVYVPHVLEPHALV